MKVVQVSHPKGPFEIVERPIPTAGPNEVVLKVLACSLCQGDKYPRVVGHEVIGQIHEAGAGVVAPYNVVGARFGVGWDGGHCGKCTMCKRGILKACEQHIFTGITVDGGMAEYCKVRAEALVRLPESISVEDSAPLLCAGLTVFNGLRNQNLPIGGFVGIQGIGGLGSIGIQFARKMGFRPIAISSSESKRALSIEMGAEAYVDTSKGDVVAQIAALTGGENLACLVATAPSSAAVQALMPAMAFDGVVLVVAAMHEPLSIDAGLLLMKNIKVSGFTAGCARENDDCIAFANAFGVKPIVEKFRMDQVTEAYDRMISAKVRFRSVIVMD
eukprot:jgi/Hompol1/2374/HPOL_005975-RA